MAKVAANGLKEELSKILVSLDVNAQVSTGFFSNSRGSMVGIGIAEALYSFSLTSGDSSTSVGTVVGTGTIRGSKSLWLIIPLNSGNKHCRIIETNVSPSMYILSMTTFVLPRVTTIRPTLRTLPPLDEVTQLNLCQIPPFFFKTLELGPLISGNPILAKHVFLNQDPEILLCLPLTVPLFSLVLELMPKHLTFLPQFIPHILTHSSGRIISCASLFLQQLFQKYPENMIHFIPEILVFCLEKSGNRDALNLYQMAKCFQ
jgi:hypothetical protein